MSNVDLTDRSLVVSAIETSGFSLTLASIASFRLAITAHMRPFTLN